MFAPEKTQTMLWFLPLYVFVYPRFLSANIVEHHISHQGIRSAKGLSAGDFADQLFEKYGNSGGKIDSTKFANLLQNMGIGENLTSAGDTVSVDKNCFSGPTLLRVFSLNASGIDKASFQTVCPAIVQQVDSMACKVDDGSKEPVETKESKMKAWGYGFLSVAIISAASLLGAFVVPFMSHDFYKKLLLFMVSLAVGVLGGSGIFHLLPNTFGLGDESDVSFLYKCAVVVGGIYFFFLLEYTMKLYIRYKEGEMKSSSHGHSHGIVSKQNGKSEIPGQGIAAAQLELYNFKGDPEKDHTSGGLVIDSKLNRKPDVSFISNVCSTTTQFSNSNSEDSITIKEPIKHEKDDKQRIAPVAWMIVIGDAVHNFIDGLAIGAAYSTSVYSGLSTALAIFCEELPHELGDFAVLLNGGMTYKQAMCFNFFSACSCFLGLVIGLLLGYSTSAVKWIYALAGGMFLYISLVDMLQEATEMSFKEGAGSLKKSLKMFALQGFGMLLGFGVMFILAMYQNDIGI